MGTNTDPYQRAEGKYRLTRGIVELLSQARNPFSILTKGTLVLRDLDLLAEAAQRTTVSLNFSIGTLDEDVWQLTEPGTPHPRKRPDGATTVPPPCNDTGYGLCSGVPADRDRLSSLIGQLVRRYRGRRG